MIDSAVADHRARLLKLYLPDALICFEGNAFWVRDQSQLAISRWIQYTGQDPNRLPKMENRSSDRT